LSEVSHVKLLQFELFQLNDLMLLVILLSSLCPPKIDVAFKITFDSKFNSDLS